MVAAQKACGAVVAEQTVEDAISRRASERSLVVTEALVEPAQLMPQVEMAHSA